MCNLYSITTNQAAIAALFRVINRAPMAGVFPDHPVRHPVFGAPPLALAKALLLPLPDGVLCGSTLFSSLGRS
jgi:hypothetical protein